MQLLLKYWYLRNQKCKPNHVKFCSLSSENSWSWQCFILFSLMVLQQSNEDYVRIRSVKSCGEARLSIEGVRELLSIMYSLIALAWFCGRSVGIELPTIEVRYENLSVDADCYVGSRALPSLWNATRNFVEVSKSSSLRHEIPSSAHGSLLPCFVDSQASIKLWIYSILLCSFEFVAHV